MSDEEWAFFEPFVTVRGPKRGRPAKNHRLVLDGVFWIARTGTPWRDLPDHFGLWSSVYRQFRRWTLSGLWDILLEALNATEAIPDSVQMIDSDLPPERPSFITRVCEFSIDVSANRLTSFK